MMAQSTQRSFRKITYIMLSWSGWAKFTQEKYLCNVGPKSVNNFAEENNLEYFLDLPEPTLHKEINHAILAHSKQITFIKKTIYIMWCPPCWDNIVYGYCLANAAQICLSCTTKLLVLCWHRVLQHVFARKSGAVSICMVACFLTGLNIAEQFWLVGQHWTWGDTDWSSIIDNFAESTNLLYWLWISFCDIWHHWH